MRPHWLIPPEPFEDLGAYRTATGEDALKIARDPAAGEVIHGLIRSGLRGRGEALEAWLTER